MRRSKNILLALACATVAGFTNPLFAATTINWANSLTSTDWATGASWIGGAAPANDLTSDIASFTTSTTGSNPTLSRDEDINGLSINTAAAAWTLSPSNGNLISLSLGTGGISLTGSNTATISTYLNLTSSTTAFTVATGSNLVLSNTVEGSGGFTLNDTSALGDAGEVTLSGANIFNGPVYVWSGTLNLENNYALGSNASSLIVSGNINGPDKWAGTLNVSGGVDIQSGGAITLDSLAYNTNVLTSSSGNNTINNLIHVLGEDIANPFTGAQENYDTIDNLVAGTTLTLTGGIDSDENPGVSVSFNGPGNVAVTNTISVGTPISGYTYASLTKMGTGTLLLSASNSMGGQVLIQDGAISVNQFAALGAGSTAGLVLGTGGTSGTSGVLQYTGSVPDTLLQPISFAATGTLGGEFDNNSPNGSVATLNAGVALGGATFTIGGSADTDLSGVSGTGNVIKSSSGNLNLSGSNGFTGTLTINAGNVLTTSDNALGSSVTVSLANSAATNFNLDNTNQTIANLQGGGAIGGNVQLGNQTLTLVSGTGSFAGAISGAGDILVNGANQNLTGTNNTYSGTVTIESGSLGISSASNLSPNSNPVLIESAGTLVLNANINVPTAVIDPTSTGTVALGTNNSTITAIPGNAWLGSALPATGVGYTLSSTTLAAGNGNVYRLGGGAGTLTISTSALGDAGPTPNSVIIGGSVILNGNNTYTGTTTVDGTLTVNNLANAGQASGIGESGVLNLSANYAWFTYQPASAGSASSNVSVNIAGASGDGNYAIFDFSYTGSGKVSLSLSGNMTSTDNSNFALWGTDSETTTTVSGAINLGTGSLDVYEGTWNLTGISNYSGTTTLQDGTLNINSDAALGNGGALIDTGGVIGILGNVDFHRDVQYETDSTSQNKINTAGFNVTYEQGFEADTNFARTGAGTLTLYQTAAITGAFQNNGGVLDVEGTISGNLTANSSSGNITIDGSVTGTAGLTGGSENFTLNGSVGSTFTTSSTGTLNFNSGSFVTGNFTNTGNGTLNFNSGSALRGNFSTSTGTVNFTGATLAGTFTNSGGTVIIDPTSTIQSSTITLSGGTTRFASITAASPANSYWPTNNKLTISGGILESQGTFARSLGAAAGDINWSSGGFSAVGGDMTVNIGGAATPTTLTLESTDFVAIGGTMSFGSAAADHTVHFDNPLVLTSSSKSGTLTISVTAGVGSTPEAEMDGTISDNSSKAGSLLKTGTGTLLLNPAVNNNSYHGSTTVQAGSLFIGTADPASATIPGALGESTTALTIGNSSSGTSNLAFEIYGANVTTSRAITVNNDGNTVTLGTASANTGTFGGAITLNKSVNLNAAAGGNAVFNAAISGSGDALTIIGAGNVQLNAANTYTGTTTVQQGTLLVGGNAPSGAAGALGNATSTIAIGNNTTGINDSPALLTDGAYTIARNLAIATGNGSRTFGGNTNANSSFTGNVALSNNVNLTSAATGSNTVTVGGIISDSGGNFALNKTGAGNATLTAANTYHGNTNIQAGTLFLSGNGSFVNSPQINISSGATLDVTADGTPFLVGSSQSLLGNGTVNGNVKLAGNLGGSLSIKGNLSGSGTLTPGDAPGILTAGSLTASAMNFNFEFSQAGSPNYADPTDSGNSVLDLTASSNPFTTALTASDTINIYLDSAALTGGTATLRGGFFTNDDAGFLSEIDGATINYYIQNIAGSTTFDGNDYSMLSPSQYNVSLSTVSDTADFAGSSGPITGEVTQINLTSAVPLPSAASAGAILLGGLAAYKRRYRK